MTAYLDTLSEHAFGNYRDLLEAVTYSPQMSDFLTYRVNYPESADGTRKPDENYAREIMQLFSIGLVELNADGTVKTGSDGAPIETYTNEDVQGLARVFTGFSYKDTGGRFWQTPDDDTLYGPLEIWPNFHSGREKTFLGHTVPAGTSGEESVKQAIDTIFAHPNVAPFVSGRLIHVFNNMSREQRGLSQGAFQSPSVFNFYTPGYRAAGSASAQAGLDAPELQLVTEGTLRGYYDYMFDFVRW